MYICWQARVVRFLIVASIFIVGFFMMLGIILEELSPINFDIVDNHKVEVSLKEGIRTDKLVNNLLNEIFNSLQN